jgi:hypothetical protein
VLAMAANLLRAIRSGLTLRQNLKNQNPGGCGIAEISKQTMNVHRRLIPDIACVVRFRLVRVDLIFNTAFEYICKNGTGVFVRRKYAVGLFVRTRSGSWRNVQYEHTGFGIADISDGLFDESRYARRTV